MTEKQFEIDGTTFTITISHFQAGSPGSVCGLPEDSYPPEAAEIEFCDKVEYAKDGNLETNFMEFNDFLKLYATHQDLDIDKALEQIESETIANILELAEEYEP